MMQSRASALVARIWLIHGAVIKMAAGVIVIMALVALLHAAGWIADKTYGHGPGWKCERDVALTNDPVCWKESAPPKPKTG